MCLIHWSHWLLVAPGPEWQHPGWLPQALTACVLTPGCLNKWDHFPCLLSCENAETNQTSHHLQNWAEVHLLILGDTCWVAQEWAQAPSDQKELQKMSFEDGKGVFASGNQRAWSGAKRWGEKIQKTPANWRQPAWLTSPRAARGPGLSEARVLGRHVMRETQPSFSQLAGVNLVILRRSGKWGRDELRGSRNFLYSSNHLGVTYIRLRRIIIKNLNLCIYIYYTTLLNVPAMPSSTLSPSLYLLFQVLIGPKSSGARTILLIFVNQAASTPPGTQQVQNNYQMTKWMKKHA